MENYLTIDGLRKIMTSINETFSKKDHKHNSKEIEGLSKVALTGRYGDLEGVPEGGVGGSVQLATSTTAGIVRPGTGLGVNSGVLNMKIAKDGGITFDSKRGLVINVDKGLSINQDNSITMNIGDGLSINEETNELYVNNLKSTIYGDSWSNLKDLFMLQIEKYRKENNFDNLHFSMVNKNVKNGEDVIVFDIPHEKIKNIDTVYNNLNILFGRVKQELQPSVSNWKLPNCSTDAEILSYEILKILSNSNEIDAFELAIYNQFIFIEAKISDIMENTIGKNLSDVIIVSDTRMKNIGITSPTTKNMFIFDSKSKKYISLIEEIENIKTSIQDKNE